MEKESSSLKNLLGIYSPSYTPDDPSMNVSVYSSSASKLSPYLSVDPYAVQQEPEFILPEGASRTRGRFEYAFGTIGGSVILGAAFGGLSGLYRGVQDTKGQSGKIRRTQLLNYTLKRGSSAGNALGVMALMYSGIGVFLSWVREEDDDLNTIAAATTTGLLYKSTAGLKRCGIGGAVGAALAGTYVLWRKWNKDRSIASYIGSHRF
jgi:import inner membrane translocase subunit TIM23